MFSKFMPWIVGLALIAQIDVYSASAQTFPPASQQVAASGMPLPVSQAPCAEQSGIPLSQGTVYYVSVLGNNRNNGLSLAYPLATISRALKLLVAGDVIVVTPGVYAGPVNMETAGFPGACSTLMGMPGATRPVITFGGSKSATINVWAPYVRISGLAVTHPESPNDAIAVWGPTTRDGNGVLRPQVHHIQIDDTVDYQAGSGGIDIVNSDYVVVEKNAAYGNSNLDPGQTSGISMYEAVDFDDNPSYHSVIMDNYSYSNENLVNARGKHYTTDGNGIIIDDFRRTQSDNVVYRSRTLIFGNIVFNNGGRGLHVYSSDHVDLINNTAYSNLNDPHLKGYPLYNGELDIGTSSNITFLNNIAVARISSLPAIVQTQESPGCLNNTWISNTVDVGFVSMLNVDPGTVFISNLVGVDPQFVVPSVDPATANFALMAESPDVAIGSPLAMMAVDIFDAEVPPRQIISVGAIIGGGS